MKGLYHYGHNQSVSQSIGFEYFSVFDCSDRAALIFGLFEFMSRPSYAKESSKPSFFSTKFLISWYMELDKQAKLANLWQAKSGYSTLYWSSSSFSSVLA